jgi:hypothetical protein
MNEAEEIESGREYAWKPVHLNNFY